MKNIYFLGIGKNHYNYIYFGTLFNVTQFAVLDQLCTVFFYDLFHFKVDFVISLSQTSWSLFGKNSNILFSLHI